ncbi:MAG TPA: hypothetical protein VHV78_06275 [Gemmatimonadaceae bacterium]|nr:hypothetical protein [Gemmatimonadaceae bacterium]
MTTPHPILSPPDASNVSNTGSPPPLELIRPLASADDFRACVDLQLDIWGAGFRVVPTPILQVSAHIGGILAGAFDAGGLLIGFVFGLTGIDDDGRVVHWSHMLGVRPNLRNGGIGRRLKEYQRRELARRRITEMLWTYDPLIAKNAHFNLNVLGARVERYAPDMYGDMGSPLHHGLATDRLIVACDTSRTAPAAPLALDPADAELPLVTAVPMPGDRILSLSAKPPARLRLEIPSDFAQLLATSAADATMWHAATRRHFQWALALGYDVAGVRRDQSTARTFYLLELRSPGLTLVV